MIATRPDHASRPTLRVAAPFSWAGRAGRVEYVVALGVALAAVAVTHAVLRPAGPGTAAPPLPLAAERLASTADLLIGSVCLLIVAAHVTRRLRAMRWPLGLTALVLVPVWNLPFLAVLAVWPARGPRAGPEAGRTSPRSRRRDLIPAHPFGIAIQAMLVVACAGVVVRVVAPDSVAAFWAYWRVGPLLVGWLAATSWCVHHRPSPLRCVIVALLPLLLFAAAGLATHQTARWNQGLTDACLRFAFPGGPGVGGLLQDTGRFVVALHVLRAHFAIDALAAIAGGILGDVTCRLSSRGSRTATPE